jgi:uncharacterized MAPEG superfamily protein
MAASGSKRRSSRALAGACLFAAAAAVAFCSALRSSFGLAAVNAGGQASAAEMQAAYQRAAQIYAVVHQQHKATIATVIALLAIKTLLLGALTTRTRLMLGNLKRAANGNNTWEEDDRMPGWFVSLIKCMLVCVGPVPSEGFLARLQGLVSNTMETEPWFMGLAVAYGLKGVTSVYAVKYAQKLMWAFLAGRVVHAIAFLLALPQPSRALGFLVAKFSLLGLAVVTLM